MGGVSGIVSSGSNIWFTNNATGDSILGSAVKINGSTGALIRVVDTQSDQLSYAHNPLIIGKDLWVSTVNGLVELKVSNGDLVRTVALSIPGGDLGGHSAASGHTLWITANKEVIGIDAKTGKQVRVLKASTLGFKHPSFLAAYASTLWVANGGGDSLDQINTTTGKLVKVFSSPQDIKGVWSMTDDGPDLWVATQNNRIVELNASTGARLRVVDVAGHDPLAMAVSGPNIWGALGDASVVELSASTAKLVRVVSLASKGVTYTMNIAVSNNHVWVIVQTPHIYSELVELNASSGAIERVLH
jgi:hypothetical protein